MIGRISYYKYFVLVLLLTNIAYQSTFASTKDGSNAWLVKKTFSEACDPNDKERFTNLFSKLLVSNRYQVISEIKSDLNMDGAQDYIAILKPKNSKLTNENTTELERSKCFSEDSNEKDYIFVSVLSNPKISNRIWTGRKFMQHMDYIRFVGIAKIRKGFQLKFLTGQDGRGDYRLDFNIVRQHVYLKRKFYQRISPDEDRAPKTITNYPINPKWNIESLSVTELLGTT